MRAHDELVEIRMPVWAWQEIVTGIEKWVGDSMSEIEILQPFEFSKVPPSWEAVSMDGVKFLTPLRPIQGDD